MLNWPLLEPGAQLAPKWWIIMYNPGRLYDERCPTQSLEVHTAERPILCIWPDLDIARNLKMKIVSADQTRLVASFRLPPRLARLAMRPLVLELSGERVYPPPPATVGAEIPQQLPG